MPDHGRLVLVVLSGPHEGRRFPVRAQGIEVSRSPEADIDLSCQEHEERDRARELRRKTKAGKGFDSMGSQSGTVTT